MACWMLPPSALQYNSNLESAQSADYSEFFLNKEAQKKEEWGQIHVFL